MELQKSTLYYFSGTSWWEVICLVPASEQILAKGKNYMNR